MTEDARSVIAEALESLLKRYLGGQLTDKAIASLVKSRSTEIESALREKGCLAERAQPSEDEIERVSRLVSLIELKSGPLGNRLEPDAIKGIVRVVATEVRLPPPPEKG